MDFDADYVTTQSDDIVISACQALLEDEGENTCGYYLRIENNSADKIQLLGKDFNITDDRGNNYCDNEFGFKGEIPELEPGEYFEFSNVTPLHAAFAVLYGSCRIVKASQNKIRNIKIPAVTLTGNLEFECTLN